MAIAVIIPSKNIENLVPCVEAVRASGEMCPISVMSDDGLQWDAQRLGHGVEGFRCPAPFIFSRNVNNGIWYSIGDYQAQCEGVVILGDDGLLQSPGGFSLLAEECRKDPTIGVIGCTTNLGHRCQKPQGVGLRFVEHFAYVAVYIPRTTIEKVGFLDERFGGENELGKVYGFEDCDYNYRVRKAGLKCAVHDGCYVDHGSLRSTFRGDPKNPAKLAPGRKIFLEKWPELEGQGY